MKPDVIAFGNHRKINVGDIMIEFGQNHNAHSAMQPFKYAETKDLEFKKYILMKISIEKNSQKNFQASRTFPQIIVDGELVGGYQEFNQYVQTNLFSSGFDKFSNSADRYYFGSSPWFQLYF